MSKTHVYFTSGRYRNSDTPRWTVWLHRVIRWLSVGAYSHCAYSDGSVVCEVRMMEGNCYWADAAYGRHPGVNAIVAVPTRYDIDLSYFEYGVGIRRSWWPTALRWLLPGICEADDCLTTTMMCLLAAGVPIRRTLRTPTGLFKDLTQRLGYPYAERRTGEAPRPHDVTA